MAYFNDSSNRSEHGDQSDRSYEEYSSSDDSYRSGGGGGDYLTSHRTSSENSVFYSHDRAKSDGAVLYEDPSQLDITTVQQRMLQMRHVVNNQILYRQTQQEKKQRNDELISHMDNLKQKDEAEVEENTKACEMFHKEKAGYETEISYYQSLSSNSQVRVVMEYKLNAEMRHQLDTIKNEKKKQHQLEQQAGFDQVTIDEYQATKRRLSNGQEKRKRLIKKNDWYTKELELAKTVEEDGEEAPHGDEIASSKGNKAVLPAIKNTGRSNMIGGTTTRESDTQHGNVSPDKNVNNSSCSSNSNSSIRISKSSSTKSNSSSSNGNKSSNNIRISNYNSNSSSSATSTSNSGSNKSKSSNKVSSSNPNSIIRYSNRRSGSNSSSNTCINNNTLNSNTISKGNKSSDNNNNNVIIIKPVIPCVPTPPKEKKGVFMNRYYRNI